MAKPRSGRKQKLSPAAAKKKAARDLKIAKSSRRTSMKAENQRRRRKSIKAGNSVDKKDFDHSTGKFVSIKANRSQFGKGTRKGVKNGQGRKNK